MTDPPDPPRPWPDGVVRRYQPQLLLYARHLVGPHRCADVVQETFARLCRQSEAGLDGHLVEWLYTVCRNVALDVRRKEGRMRLVETETFTEMPSGSPDPARSAESSDAAERAMRLLDRLPENQREVVRLKFQHNLSYRQIAGVTKLSESNVGFLLHTALKRLRELMDAPRGENTSPAARG